MSDNECLNNARSQCDNDPSCFGVSWYPHYKNQKLRICLSREMAQKRDGWRTMMKSTMIKEGHVGKQLVNIEDCTKGPRHWHVMDMIKCGQRNDKRLKEKLNELVGVINPEYSKQLY